MRNTDLVKVAMNPRLFMKGLVQKVDKDIGNPPKAPSRVKQLMTPDTPEEELDSFLKTLLNNYNNGHRGQSSVRHVDFQP